MISETGVVWFYLVPVAVFGAMLFALWWVVGGKTLFKPTEEAKENKRLREEEKKRNAEELRKKRARIKSIKKDRMVRQPQQWAAQAALYAAFAAFIGYLGGPGLRWDAPIYLPHPPDMGLIKVSLSHPGRREEECIRPTAEQLAKLPPNRRRLGDCSRKRWPVTVQVEMNGERVYTATQEPSGLSGDGSSNFYHRLVVSAGFHRLVTRVRDVGDSKDFQYILDETVEVTPRQVLVIGMKPGLNELFYK